MFCFKNRKTQPLGLMDSTCGFRGLVEECDRKLLALADQMTTVEESHRHDVEQLHAEIQELTNQTQAQ